MIREEHTNIYMSLMTKSNIFNFCTLILYASEQEVVTDLSKNIL